MAVVINDFEILIQRPPEQDQQPAQPPAPAPLRPLDITDIMRRQAERLARLTAL
jgi:hypothetical protein